MAKVKQSDKLKNVLHDIRGPVLEQAEKMEAAGQRILRLNIGNPDPSASRHRTPSWWT